MVPASRRRSAKRNMSREIRRPHFLGFNLTRVLRTGY
jgi:hypothetical protein